MTEAAQPVAVIVDGEHVWPSRLMIRDTKLHDDMGGGGQRIYTTAGRGYEKREYIRADAQGELREALEALLDIGPDTEPLVAKAAWMRAAALVGRTAG